MLRKLRLFNKAMEAEFCKLGSKTWSIPFTPENIYTNDMKFATGKTKFEPLFRVTDWDGNVINPAFDPQLDKETAVKIHTSCIVAREMDSICYELQRQGTMSFYMVQQGEETVVVGTAAALNDKDMVFGQYREAAVLLYRGYQIKQFLAQAMSRVDDPAKGRQMPIHYGSPEHAFQTISSPLGTQIPHASGAGYAYRLEKKGKIVVCFFGDGAASEGDFHAGVNFAATLKSHTLFFCRNNGYAISTPTHEQYSGDGIFARGVAYGIPSIRVDGNDVLAVYAAVQEARKTILRDNTPVLVEAMAYRGGHHSTSDDSSRYRNDDEKQRWINEFSGITRFEKYLIQKGWWDQAKTKEIGEQARQEVLTQLNILEGRPYPALETLTHDVYDAEPWNLLEQKKDLLEHVERHSSAYEAQH